MAQPLIIGGQPVIQSGQPFIDSNGVLCCCAEEDCFFHAIPCACNPPNPPDVWIACADVSAPVTFRYQDWCYQVGPGSISSPFLPMGSVLGSIRTTYVDCNACCACSACDCTTCSGGYTAQITGVSPTIFPSFPGEVCCSPSAFNINVFLPATPCVGPFSNQPWTCSGCTVNNLVGSLSCLPNEFNENVWKFLVSVNGPIQHLTDQIPPAGCSQCSGPSLTLVFKSATSCFTKCPPLGGWVLVSSAGWTTGAMTLL